MCFTPVNIDQVTTIWIIRQMKVMCHDDDATVAPLFLNIISNGGAADYWSSALGAYKRGVKRHNGRPVYTQVSDVAWAEKHHHLWWDDVYREWCVSFQVGHNPILRSPGTHYDYWRYLHYGAWSYDDWTEPPCFYPDKDITMNCNAMAMTAITELPRACSITLSCDTLLPQDMAHPEVMGR